MTFAQHRIGAIAAITFFAGGGFVLDTFTPLGVSDWIWYVVPLLLSVYLSSRLLPFLLAAVLSVLTLAGFFLSPPGIDPQLALTSRLIGILLFWVMAIVICLRKRAEEKNLQLAAIVESSDDAVIGKTLDGIITSWNKGAEKIYGYSANEAVGKPITLLIPAGHENKVPLIIERIRREEQVGHYETLHQRKDGAIINVSIAVSPVKDIEGRIIGASVVTRNITGRKQVDEALVTEQRLLNSLITSTPDQVYFKDRESRFTRINEAFARRHGLSDLRQILGKTDSDLFGEEHARQACEDEQRIMAMGQPMIDKEEKEDWKDGRVTWVSSTKMPLCDSTGKIVGIMGISRDITERKRAEEALRAEHEFNQEVISGAGEGIVVYDRELRPRLWNRFMEQLTGMPAKEVLGRKALDLFPHLREQGVDRLLERALKGESVCSGDVPYHMPRTGRKGWVKGIYGPHRGASGEIIGVIAIVSDITERKRAEEALRAEHEFNQEVISGANEGIIVYDREFRYRLWNRFMEQLTGMPAEEVLGRKALDLFPQFQEQGVDRLRERALKGESVFSDDIPYHMPKTGRKGWVKETYGPHRGASGEIIGVIGIVHEITERKRAEEEIVHLASFPKLSPAPIVEVDKTGQVRFLNHAAEKRFPDLKTLGIRHPYLADLVSTLAVIQAEPIHSLIREVTIGSLCYQRVMYHVADTQTIRIYGFDITERKRAEEQTRELAQLLDLAHDAIMVCDMDNRILYWNKGAEQVFGWTTPEALKQHAWQLLHKEIFEFKDAKKALLEKGKWNGELTCQTKHGQEVVVESRLTLVRDNQGKPKLILGISTDITEKKKIEAQFLRSQRMESLGTLAGGIAHDLNNVLTPLLFSLALLKEKIADDEGQKLLDMLQANVHRGADLVKQVLAFGRGVKGERIAVHPAHVAREIKQIVHETFPKSVVFEFHPATDLWNIIGDPTQLHQVLLNLCLNARDAMPRGGKLSIDMKNTVLDEVSAGMNLEARPGPYVCIKVADTGVGISKKIQERIYDPFFTTKEPGKGTGLGLSTTLAIVKSHGGFINCYSEVGKGTTFKVHLPASTTPVAAENTVVEPAKLPHGQNELVLVVDDEESVCRVAKKTLEHFGYRVLLAANGIEALSLYAPRRDEIDVVITDMAMPGMDGFATIGALRAINPQVKIVGSSGLASTGGAAKAINAGLRHFISKPFTAELMLQTVHKALHEHFVN
jgi:PAS domain S-box-containing protein